MTQQRCLEEGGSLGNASLCESILSYKWCGLIDRLRQEQLLWMIFFVHATHFQEGRCHVSPALTSLAMLYLG